MNTKMGVIWTVYCPTHREILDLDKWWHLARVGRLRREDIHWVRRELSRVRAYRSPNETKSDDRILDLVTAFLERHTACEVRAINDMEKNFESEIGVFAIGWKTFHVGDDGPLQGYDQLARADELRRYVAKWTPKLEEAKGRLDGRRAFVFGRKRLGAWTSDMEGRLRRAEKEIGEIESQPTPSDRDPGQSARAQEALTRMDTKVKASLQQEIQRLERELESPLLWPWKRRKIMRDLRDLRSEVAHLTEYVATERSGPWALGYYLDLLQRIRETPLGG